MVAGFHLNSDFLSSLETIPTELCVKSTPLKAFHTLPPVLSRNYSCLNVKSTFGVSTSRRKCDQLKLTLISKAQ